MSNLSSVCFPRHRESRSAALAVPVHLADPRCRIQEDVVFVAELWRYPVKSMAGERLRTARLLPDALLGDRVVQVYGREGRVVTARTRPLLLGHRAALGPGGEPLVDGRPWSWAEVARDVEAAAGPGARLARWDDPAHSTCCRCWWRPMGPSPHSAIGRHEGGPRQFIDTELGMLLA